MSYFSLHNHSEFSNIRFLDSTNKISHLFKRAIDLNLKGFALTDHETLSGSVQMVKTYKELKEQGALPDDFKIALGDEIYLIESVDEYKNHYDREKHSFYHFILVAKDEIGWEALKVISSTAWSNSFTQGLMTRVPIQYDELADIMSRYKGHIIASSSCLGGFIPKLIIEERDKYVNNEQRIINFINYCKSIFGEENFFLEIQPNLGADQVYVNKRIREISKITKTKIIYTTDSHYLSKNDRFVHKSYLNSDEENDREVDDFYMTTYMMGKDEVYDYLKDYVSIEEFEEWTQNTIDIHSSIKIYDLFQEQEVPTVEVRNFPKRKPTKELLKYESLCFMLEDDNIQNRYWVNYCLGALKNKNLYNDVYISRLNDEATELLKISVKLNQTMTKYYNTMQQIMREVWKISLIGAGRGSAAGFLSCYLLDITDVDPIKQSLPFWRLAQ